MFWRFGFQTPSAIDTLLDHEDVSLEDILEEEDVLQESKAHNQKLVDFFCRHDNATKLLEYIITAPVEKQRRFKYPFLAGEIMACEIPQLVDTIVLEHKELLPKFWAFLDQDEVDNENNTSLQAQYFCKSFAVFLTKRTGEVLDFIKSDPKHLKQILARLKTPAIVDLLLTLVRVEELSEGHGIVQWLSDHGLLDNLVNRLDPNLDSEEHSVAQQCICEIIRMSQTSIAESPSIGPNDLIMALKSKAVIQKLVNFMLDTKAPNSTSTLINGVTIIIDLIRHNSSDMDNEPMLSGMYGFVGNSMVRPASVSLDEMLKVLADNVGNFNELLRHPRSINGPVRTTLGDQIPLGFERLKICELFAEILHCSNMSNLNESSDGQVGGDNYVAAGRTLTIAEDSTSIGDYLKIQFVEKQAMSTCLDLFFKFPWNNFLHYVVYDMLHQIFNGRMDKGYNRQLAISIFRDGKLTDRMVKIQKENDAECAKPKGMRLGYMGHLTFIAEEVIKLFEGYPETILQEVKADMDSEGWNEYRTHALKDTKERDRLPLAGSRLSESDAVAPAKVQDGSAAGQFLQYDEEEEAEVEHQWIAGQLKDGIIDGYTKDNVFSNDNIHFRVAGGREDEDEGDNSDDGDEEVSQDWTRGFATFIESGVPRRDVDQNNRNNEEDEDPFGDFTGSSDNGQEAFISHFDEKLSLTTQSTESSSTAETSATTGAVEPSQQQQQQQGMSLITEANTNDISTTDSTASKGTGKEQQPTGEKEED